MDISFGVKYVKLSQDQIITTPADCQGLLGRFHYNIMDETLYCQISGEKQKIKNKEALITLK